jgi:hypothetical protein
MLVRISGKLSVNYQNDKSINDTKILKVWMLLIMPFKILLKVGHAKNVWQEFVVW